MLWVAPGTICRDRYVFGLEGSAINNPAGRLNDTTWQRKTNPFEFMGNQGAAKALLAVWAFAAKTGDRTSNVIENPRDTHAAGTLLYVRS